MGLRTLSCEVLTFHHVGNLKIRVHKFCYRLIVPMLQVILLEEYDF